MHASFFNLFLYSLTHAASCNPNRLGLGLGLDFHGFTSLHLPPLHSLPIPQINLSAVLSHLKQSTGTKRFAHSLTLTRTHALTDSVEGPTNSWVNTVNLSAGKNKFPGDRFGYSIASREKDDVILIGTTFWSFYVEEIWVKFWFLILIGITFRSISRVITILPLMFSLSSLLSSLTSLL